MTPYDAEATTFYMATVAPDGLLPIETISSFQRKQMDPNYDWLFNDTPCIVSNQNHFCILVEGRIKFQAHLIFVTNPGNFIMLPLFLYFLGQNFCNINNLLKI